MGLSINTTPAKLSIETIAGKLQIDTRRAQLELTQQRAKVNIKTEQPRILIDQYECFAEEGLKNTIDLAKDLSQRAYQSVMEYIAKTAQDGDEMAKIGNKASIMLDIIKSDSIIIHDFNMVTMPMSRPKIDVAGGTVDIQVEPQNDIGEINGVTRRFIPGEITFNNTPSTLNIKVQSYGSINISYSGNNVDSYI